MNDSSSRQMLLLIVLSMGMLVLLSAVPWSDLTGNYIKDFNLFGDVFPQKKATDNIAMTAIPSDPGIDGLEDFADDVDDPAPGDDGGASAATAIDSIIPAKALAEAPTDGDIVLVESYLPDGSMFPKFRAALDRSGSRAVRIAVLGDSYIEGDILSQDLRALLQDRYGGSGVGFVPLHCDFPGFRSSVKMSDKGWKLHDVRSMKSSDSIRQLSCDYAVAEENAAATYRGTKKNAHTGSWEHSAFLFLAPDSAVVTLTTDAGTSDFAVSPSSGVQCLEIPGATSMFGVSASSGVTGLGVYLGTPAGVQLDCMSIRGNSGLPLRKINTGLSGQIRRWFDYDLIILEYGMNAVNAEELEYSAYGIGLTRVIKKLKGIYPDADILVLGIGDRGVKGGTAVVSLPTCQAMVNAQRKAAADAGVHFWDMRAAMGGEGAAAEWRSKHWLNADYIHLNHDGGRELAGRLYKALTHD